MDLGISDKSALILGGSRGLGFGVAEALAREGVRLLLVARDGDALEKAARTLQDQHGADVAYHVADLRQPEAGTRIAEEAARMGGVDILVNNGGGPPAMPITEASDAVWEANFQSMVLSVVSLTRAVLPTMRDRGWGRILTIVSSGVIQPIDRLGLSNSLRSALVGWSKTLSREVAHQGITVNCLAPGRIQTDRVEQLDAAAARAANLSIEEIARRSRETIPTGRYGRVEEFGSVAAFLASGQASYVTGSVVRVDGGLIRGV